MADPRTYTVKQCQPAYASKSGAGIANSTSTRRDFFNSVGKVGDLNVLNSVGGGKVGAGLRNLASISNSIRTGCGALPSTIGSTLDSGANWVLEQTGIAPTVINALQGFNPGIANQAFGQAKNVFQQVKGGSFKSSSIPGVIQDFTNLERLSRNIFTPSGTDAQTSLGEHCEASAYALDLIARAPKYKFLFVVQFIPESGYAQFGNNDLGPLDMAFAVKRTTRPDAHFVHEDVNYYNFRTKYATRTEFQEMNMVFHDDTMNLGMTFYKAYLSAMSPITNLEPMDSSMLEEGGMDFVGNTLVDGQVIGRAAGSKYAASHGTLANDNKQIFKEIRLYHVFDYGQRMTVFRFMNPRLSQMALDELDMSVGSEGCEITMSFNYDSVYIDHDVSMANDTKYKLRETQRGAVYPLRYNAGATATEGPQSSGINPFGQPIQPASSCDPLNTTNTSTTSGGGIGGAISTAVSDLGSKFSNPFGGFTL